MAYPTAGVIWDIDNPAEKEHSWNAMKIEKHPDFWNGHIALYGTLSEVSYSPGDSI